METKPTRLAKNGALITVIFFSLFVNIVSSAQVPTVSNCSIIRLPYFKSKFVDARNIDVWLPNNYSPSKKYAVLYMQDGKGLFDSSIMWNKQEWGVDETMQRLIDSHQVIDCIVVGIWNAEKKRHLEYFPQKVFNALAKEEVKDILSVNRANGEAVFANDTLLADNYLKFLVQELKPFIDTSFSTNSAANNTFIAGSSMGALISMYAICEYPNVFGAAACLSTHWPGIFRVENNPIPDKILKYLAANLPESKNHKFYFDYGTATLDSLYKPFQLRADAIMKKKGYSSSNWVTKEFIGANHSEKAWSERLAVPLLFLLKK